MKTTLCLVIVISLVLISCDSTTDTPIIKTIPTDTLKVDTLKIDSVKIKKTFLKEMFPMSVGNWWRYQFSDIYTKNDTIIIRVISEVDTNGGKLFTCTVERYKMIIDTSYYEISDTKLTYRSKFDYSYFGNFILKLPFIVGEKWVGNDVKDTMRAVSRSDSIGLLRKYYKPIFSVKRTYSYPGYSIIQNLIVTPSIGIIYQTIDERENSTPNRKEGFILIDYKVN